MTRILTTAIAIAASLLVIAPAHAAELTCTSVYASTVSVVLDEAARHITVRTTDGKVLADTTYEAVYSQSRLFMVRFRGGVLMQPNEYDQWSVLVSGGQRFCTE